MLRSLTCTVLVMFILLISASAVLSETTAPADTVSKAPIDIYIDCGSCDDDYLQTELGMANFVRDKNLADVYLLVTRQRTGSGGREYTLEFIGQNRFTSLKDTLLFRSQPSDTEDMNRVGLLQTIRKGLVRYIARTPHAKHLEIKYNQPTVAIKTEDPWKSWIFSISIDGFLNGQSAYSRFDMYGDLSARKVTKDLRLQFYLGGSYGRNTYEIDDLVIESHRKSGGAEAYFAINDHWSYAFATSWLASTYSNRDFHNVNLVGLEYNLFPYSESTQKQLRFTYFLGTYYTDYTTQTILGKDNEWTSKQSVEVALEMIQPWGSVETSLRGSNFMDDIEKYRLTLRSDVSVRVTTGLSFNVYTSFARIQDQINLAATEVSSQDILTNAIELPTSYSYSMFGGISYSFGSVNNSAVNPRFGY